MRSSLTALFTLTAVLIMTRPVFAGGPCSGVKGGCHRSTYVAEPRWSPPVFSPPPTSSNCRTWVKGHMRDGSFVDGHYRNTSCSGSSGPSKSKTSYRSSARTSSRSKYWNGTGSEYNEPTEEDRRRYARPTNRELEQEVPNHPNPPKHKPIVTQPPSLPAHYRVYYTSKREQDIFNYQDHDDTYRLFWTSGGSASYPKSLIDRIEKLDTAQPASNAAP